MALPMHEALRIADEVRAFDQKLSVEVMAEETHVVIKTDRLDQYTLNKLKAIGRSWSVSIRPIDDKTLSYTIW